MLRQEPAKLDELLHPVFNKEALKKAHTITKGLPASPGAACGRVVFFADEAEEWKNRGEKVVLVRLETSPEDLRGMNVAEGILTARGGMTSHAAVVARGMTQQSRFFINHALVQHVYCHFNHCGTGTFSGWYPYTAGDHD